MIGDMKEISVFFLFRLVKIKNKLRKVQGNIKKNISDSIVKRKLINDTMKEIRKVEEEIVNLSKSANKEKKEWLKKMKEEAAVKESCLKAKFLAEIGDRTKK